MDGLFAEQIAAASPVALSAGSSGFFDPPAAHLDPNLFDAQDRIHPVVREFLLSALHRFLAGSFSSPKSWATAYLAGSGAGYQWGGARSEDGKPGDLDVLVSVDWERFYAHQSLETAQMPIYALTGILNYLLRNNLWPKTASTVLGDGTYEVTFYVNALANPIETIDPYAAYDLSSDRWAVRPDPDPQHPQNGGDYAAVSDDLAQAQQLANAYNTALTRAHAAASLSPEWVDAVTELHHATLLAEHLFNEIHGARSQAFSPGGEGYSDQANFRWQAGKANGAIGILSSLKAAAAPFRPTPSAGYTNAADMLVSRAVRGQG